MKVCPDARPPRAHRHRLDDGVLDRGLTAAGPRLPRHRRSPVMSRRFSTPPGQLPSAGEIAPMSLITYQEVRPWARAISKQVHDGVMPPWHADAPPGTFSNERRLTPGRKTCSSVGCCGSAGRRLEGPAGTASVCRGLATGKAGRRVRDGEDHGAARGTVRMSTSTSRRASPRRSGSRIEARPGNRALVHHILVFYEAPPDQPGSPQWFNQTATQQGTAKRSARLRPQQNNGLPQRLLALRPTHGNRAAGVSR